MQICEGCTHFCDIPYVASGFFFLFFFNHMSQILECVCGVLSSHTTAARLVAATFLQLILFPLAWRKQKVSKVIKFVAFLHSNRMNISSLFHLRELQGVFLLRGLKLEDAMRNFNPEKEKYHHLI